MTSLDFKPFLIGTMMVSALALGACSTTTPSTGTKPVSSVSTSGTEDPAKSTVQNTIDTALEQAIVDAESRGNKQESLTLLDQISKRNPNDPMVAARFARALREDEQLKRARQVLSPFISGKNAHPETLTEMSMVNLGMGEYSNAITNAQRSIDLDPKQGRAFLALGTALDAQGDHAGAEKAFRQGLNIWKGDPAPILNNLALNLAAQGNIDEALNVLDRARKLSPGRMEIERNYRIISTLNEGQIKKKPTATPASSTPDKKPATAPAKPSAEKPAVKPPADKVTNEKPKM
ncbi:MAG: tetratricopeptide repeat protein [Alphaproteobacteria bacterium]|nr:tetratricopeptide repeat protein [Alphaproteobacteria bacterium]